MARSFALASLVVAAEAFTSAPSTTLLSTSTNAPSRNGQRAGLLSLRAVGNRPDPTKMGNPVATSTSAGFTPRRMGTGTLTRQSAVVCGGYLPELLDPRWRASRLEDLAVNKDMCNREHPLFISTLGGQSTGVNSVPRYLTVGQHLMSAAPEVAEQLRKSAPTNISRP